MHYLKSEKWKWRFTRLLWTEYLLITTSSQELPQWCHLSSGTFIFKIIVEEKITIFQKLCQIYHQLKCFKNDLFEVVGGRGSLYIDQPKKENIQVLVNSMTYRHLWYYSSKCLMVFIFLQPWLEQWRNSWFSSLAKYSRKILDITDHSSFVIQFFPKKYSVNLKNNSLTPSLI